MTSYEYFIPYKNGGGVMVDWDFTNPIHCLNWYKEKSGYSRSMIYIGNQKYKEILMHRMLLEYPKENTDHINGIRNDNRLSNLREVTVRENAQNRIEHRNGGLPGARYYKITGRWRSMCTVNNETIYLGFFDTEQQAHDKYLKYLEEIK